jgi:hypothetical protein
MIWEPLIELSTKITELFDSHLERVPLAHEVNFEGWSDTYWKSDAIRKCHHKFIDNRETQKLWLMHINIFPAVDTDLPILGFDIVAGQSKITGSFFDFSPVSTNTHSYLNHLKTMTEHLVWSKPRELPAWAQDIFSDYMIAAGNLKTESEVKQLCSISYQLIEYYLNNIDKHNKIADSTAIIQRQNQYCKQQKLNPHLHKSILSMGISEQDKNAYIDKILFEEL